MTLEALAIVAPILGTVVLIALALTFSNRDVARFQTWAAARRSDAASDAIERSEQLRKAALERFLKATSALNPAEVETARAAISRTDFEAADANTARYAQLAEDYERALTSDKV